MGWIFYIHKCLILVFIHIGWIRSDDSMGSPKAQRILKRLWRRVQETKEKGYRPFRYLTIDRYLFFLIKYHSPTTTNGPENRQTTQCC